MLATPTPRDWASIFISLVVILSIMSTVALVVSFLSPEAVDQNLQNSEITLEDISTGKLLPNKVNATWITGWLVVFFYSGLYFQLDVFRDTKIPLETTS